MDQHASKEGLHQGEVTTPPAAAGATPGPAREQPGLPRVGITIGDPAGIGPELIGLAMLDPAIKTEARLRVIGDAAGHHPGKPTVASAKAAWEALEEAVRLLKSGGIEAVVTCPISKARMDLAGFPFPGHTEFFADRMGAAEYSMILSSPSLTVSPVTIHLPLAEAIRVLDIPSIVRAGRLLADFLVRLGKEQPRVAVAGLNPHAGEEGLLGKEEDAVIRPAVAELRRLRPQARFEGPEPPDTVFHRAAQGEFDAVLGMYHDQALIPLKLIGFHDGVNVTAGLPFPRTSPDHGTAFEIAGKGAARPDSLLAAIRLAARLARARPSARSE